MGRVTERRRVLRIRDGAAGHRADTLVAEEPLEIRLNGRPLAITMRTPGDDFALAVGFLVSEGVLAAADEVADVVYCAGATADGGNTYNVVDVTLAPGVPVARHHPGAERVHHVLVRPVRQGQPGRRADRDADAAGRPGPAAARPPSCWPRCRTGCARRRRSSTAPAACTRRRCSAATANCWTCARTSGGTTPSTSWSAGRCGRGGCRWPDRC